MVACVEGVPPQRRAIRWLAYPGLVEEAEDANADAHWHEERRLFYVGTTRPRTSWSSRRP
jgi:superfamily I DNA/RNA helicase